MSKRPDNFSENAGILPYGSNTSAPSITVPDVDLFKDERTSNAGNYFKERLNKLEREYQELVELAETTQKIYDAKYNFIPKVGHIYHLYWTGEYHLLSLIDNWDKYEYNGSYRFTSDNIWEWVEPEDE